MGINTNIKLEIIWMDLVYFKYKTNCYITFYFEVFLGTTLYMCLHGIDMNTPKDCVRSVLGLCDPLFEHTIVLCVFSQSVWVQDCGVVKCCGGLAEDRRQHLVGKRPGASPHSPQWSKTLSFLHSLSLHRVCGLCYVQKLYTHIMHLGWPYNICVGLNRCVNFSITLCGVVGFISHTLVVRNSWDCTELETDVTLTTLNYCRLKLMIIQWDTSHKNCWLT